jgi:hypothetical protein
MVEPVAQSHRGECPACGLPVPFLKTQLGLGRPFCCKLCGSEIVVPKVKQSAAFGLYVLATAFAKSLGFLITILMLAAGMALSWPFATVTLVRRAD